MRPDYVYLLLILLIPILPAFILFTFLPSSSDVEGPLKGLKVKLGGAFAGYIVAVFLSWKVAISLLEPTWSDNWTVLGQVKFDGAAHPRPSEALVMVRPPAPDIDKSGGLHFSVAIPRYHDSATDIPRLIITYEGYETAAVPLDSDRKHLASYGGEDYQVTFDVKNRHIFIKKPIVLSKEGQ
jgi:hypothetical protein